MASTLNVNLSTRLLNILKSNNVTPRRFRELLATRKSSTTVSNMTGVSERTVRQYRQTANTTPSYTFGI